MAARSVVDDAGYVVDLAPPVNPVARVVRDSLFEVDNGPAMPPGVSVWDLGFQKQVMKTPLPVLIRCHERFGGVFSAPLAHQRQVLVTSPDAVRQILTEQADCFSWRGGNFGDLIALLGDGVLTTDGSLHDRSRSLMDPGFHRRRMEENLAVIVREAAAAADSLRSGEVVDIGAWSRRLTMRVAMSALVGFDAEQRDLADEAAELFEDALSFFSTGFTRFLRGPRTPWRRMTHAKEALHALVMRQVEITRARPEPGPDLLSILVETRFDDGRGYTDREICDQVMTLLFAGHDTTSSLLAFLFYELARNSTIQDETRANVLASTGIRSEGAPLDLEFGALLGSMPLLSRAIDETLRLYPPVWIGARRATTDVTLGGHCIPAGAYVNYLPWVIHHLPQYYPMPEAFRPERFAPENRAQIPPGAYVPFGGGDRICLGQRFGLTVAHAASATVLSRFRLETTASTRLRVNIMPTLTAGGLVLRPVLDNGPLT